MSLALRYIAFAIVIHSMSTSDLLEYKWRECERQCCRVTSPCQQNNSLIISFIIPITTCDGQDCDFVDFRVLDILGLQYAAQHLAQPISQCVELEVCNSASDVIAATNMISTYGLSTSCTETCGSKDRVCMSECDNGECKQHVAIVGPGRPEAGEALAGITAAVRTPQLLYSTGDNFRDKYPYLHQMSPDYSAQVKAMVRELIYHNWTYIAIITTEDTYGRIGYEKLTSELDNSKVCIQFSIRLLTFQLSDNLDIFLRDITANAIILWMEGTYASLILNYFKHHPNRVFIASDGWSVDTSIISQYRDMLDGRFIGFFPNYTNYVTLPNTFADQCQGFLPGYDCSRALDMIKNRTIHGHAAGIYHSLDSLYNALGSISLDMTRTINRMKEELNDKLKIGRREERSRREERDVVNIYTIQSGELKLAVNREVHPKQQSVCSEPCQYNEYSIPDEKHPRCCHKCARCPTNSFVLPHKLGCEQCDKCFRPNHNMTQCIEKEEAHFSFLAGDIFSLCVVSMSLLGMVMNIFILLTLIKHSNTPIVKASSPELCYIMLGSLAVLLVAPILMVSGPSDLTCPLQRYIIGLGTVIPIAVILLRTNRINIIFNRKSFITSTFQKMFMGVKSNIMFVFLLSMFQFAICMILHMYHDGKDPDTGNLLHVTRLCDEEKSFKMCNENLKMLIYVWFGYVCFLILGTTYVSYRTRRLPANFNETKYICLTMFIIVVLSSSTICTYLVLDSKTNIIYQCCAIITAVYCVTGLIFGHKMYVIYIMPSQNIRSDTNVALRKFIKQDSGTSYSTLLTPRLRSSSTSVNSSSSLRGSSSAKGERRGTKMSAEQKREHFQKLAKSKGIKKVKSASSLPTAGLMMFKKDLKRKISLDLSLD